ncbi:MAG: hypothetical protein DMG24_21235 [Acidobacteria bacterium]|nr:MAG: hypothetical protein DMG24_21235 [Acidobacteriota bacterium]
MRPKPVSYASDTINREKKMLRIIRSSDAKSLDRVFRARKMRLEAAEPAVRRILDDVRRQGDRALVRYTRRFDGVDLDEAGFTVSAQQIREAYIMFLATSFGRSAWRRAISGRWRRASCRGPGTPAMAREPAWRRLSGRSRE